MKQVLVLCMGNACRSQMAEAYLQYYGSGKAQFYSAGLYPNVVHPLAIQVMAEDNIDISGYNAKTMELFRDQPFDYALSMCKEVSAELPAYILKKQEWKLWVPDPLDFIGNEEDILQRFREIRDLIKTKILKFIGQELLVPQGLHAFI